MTKQSKLEALQNALQHYGFPKKYFVTPSDARSGVNFAIASKGKGDFGSETLIVHSRFMTYDEFNAYLFGWYDAKMKKF